MSKLQSTMNAAPPAPKETFPCLKRYIPSEGMYENVQCVVLFTSPEEGTVVFSSDDDFYTLGFVAKNWIPSSWEPFCGEITLLGK